MLNTSFTGLKGLGDPQNASVLRKMGEQFREDFTAPAREVFEKIDEASGDKDVFVKLSERIIAATNKVAKQYNIELKDNKNKTLASSIFTYTPGALNKQQSMENCKKSLYNLADNYILKNTRGYAANDVEYMINRYV